MSQTKNHNMLKKKNETDEGVPSVSKRREVKWIIKSLDDKMEKSISVYSEKIIRG